MNLLGWGTAYCVVVGRREVVESDEAAAQSEVAAEQEEVPFAVAAEYEYFTGKSPFSRNEVSQMIDMICEMVFIREP